MSSLFDKFLQMRIRSLSGHLKYSSEILFPEFQKALRGCLRKEFLIFPSDPGRGKSRGVQLFLEKMRSGEITAEDGGVVIFLSRREEIKDYISGGKLSAADFAVLDSQFPPDRVACYGGNLHAENAPILFVTSQLLHSRCGRSFEEFEEAFYKGGPRKLRIWDEEFSTGDIVTLSVDELATLRSRLRGQFSTTAALLERLETAVREAAPGERVMVPSIPDYNEACGRGVISLEQRSALEGIAGKSGVISRSLGVASILVERRRLPADLAPLFVLDASARVSTNYDIMKSGGVAINMLPSADYSYRNAEFLTMRMGAGRSTLLENRSARDRVIGEVVAKLNEEPHDEFLVLYNELNGFDVTGHIKSSVLNPTRLSFVKWGNHKASNRCRNIKKVICIGLLRYSDVGYDKIRMSCLGDDADRGAHIERLRLSEARATILQGVARCNMRNGTSKECGDCKVYIVDSERDIDDLLRITFPDCRTAVWEKTILKISKGENEVLNFILGLDRASLSKGIKRSYVWQKMALDKSNFAKMIAKPNFKLAAARHNISIGSRIIRLDESV